MGLIIILTLFNIKILHLFRLIELKKTKWVCLVRKTRAAMRTKINRRKTRVRRVNNLVRLYKMMILRRFKKV